VHLITKELSALSPEFPARITETISSHCWLDFAKPCVDHAGMTRLSRIVIPGHPHHVTQRGNGCAQTFFSDADYALYRGLLAKHCSAAGVAIWSWCLMPNHVHLVLIPSDTDGLRRALAPTHRHYAGIIHARRRISGHFWQGRYGSVVMDEPHLLAALAYVALNPVRAGLVARAQDWRWSSTRAHLSGQEDGITALAPIRDRVPAFADFLAKAADAQAFQRLRKAERVGRPLGDDAFLGNLECFVGRKLKTGKPGPKPKEKISAAPP
jgi:putative transposase